MKRRRGKDKATATPAAEVFLRGFLATALLSALQGRAAGTAPPPWRQVLRHGIQGGAALTAATTAAEAIGRRDYGTGATAVLAGAVAVVAAETALQIPLTQENFRGQEET